MRGHFSIEWLAQSSQSTSTESPTVSTGTPTAFSTSGTHPESLPGFYCKQREATLHGDQRGLNHVLNGSELGTHHPHSAHIQQVPEHGFSSGTEEETSGYESEGSRSLSPTTPDSASTSPASPPSGRRPRTAFTAEQISSLERSFKRNAYLGTQDKAELCKKLDLSDNQVRNWFQNRRMKLKRTMQDALARACQANVATQLYHYPELQPYQPNPCPRYHSGQEVQTASHYLHPQSLYYSSPAVLPSVPALPLDSIYQYPSFPGMVLPSGTTQMMGSYQQFPQHY